MRPDLASARQLGCWPATTCSCCCAIAWVMPGYWAMAGYHAALTGQSATLAAATLRRPAGDRGRRRRACRHRDQPRARAEPAPVGHRWIPHPAWRVEHVLWGFALRRRGGRAAACAGPEGSDATAGREWSIRNCRGWIVGSHHGTWLTIGDHGVQRWILAGPAEWGSRLVGNDPPLGLGRWFEAFTHWRRAVLHARRIPAARLPLTATASTLTSATGHETFWLPHFRLSAAGTTRAMTNNRTTTMVVGGAAAPAGDARGVQKPRPRTLSSGDPSRRQSANGPVLPLPHGALACRHAAQTPPQRPRQQRRDRRATPPARGAAPPGQMARVPTRRSCAPCGAAPSASPRVLVDLSGDAGYDPAVAPPAGCFVVQAARRARPG